MIKRSHLSHFTQFSNIKGRKWKQFKSKLSLKLFEFSYFIIIYQTFILCLIEKDQLFKIYSTSWLVCRTILLLTRDKCMLALDKEFIWPKLICPLQEWFCSEGGYSQTSFVIPVLLHNTHRKKFWKYYIYIISLLSIASHICYLSHGPIWFALLGDYYCYYCDTMSQLGRSLPTHVSWHHVSLPLMVYTHSHVYNCTAD